jgi:ribosomal protein S18 acetylase RimI-like enzyme
MLINIERCDPAIHNLSQVAELIYNTDTELMKLFFGLPEKGIKIIESLVKRPSNHFSYANIICVVSGKDVVGLLAGYNAERKKVIGRKCISDYLRALSLFQAFKMAYVDIRLNKILKENITSGEYYIQNICVNEKVRGRGVGSMLLDHAMRNNKVVWLHVNINNDGAKKLYEKKGFKPAGMNEVKYRKNNIGMIEMKRVY